MPESWQFFFESLYKFVFNIVQDQTGSNGYKYFPFVFTLFFFVLLTNLLGLVPFGIALTSHLIVILFLSLTVCGGIFIIGLVTHNFKFLKIFVPESPLLLLPVLIPIEIFSYIIRMFSLAIRLSANILAGHTLVFIISTFILKMFYIKNIFYFIFVMPLLMILLLEFGVAFLQAYIFTILICIYLSDSVNIKHH